MPSSRTETALGLGASDQAVEHAVWDLLWRLAIASSFRQDMEVVREPARWRSVDAVETPSYLCRSIVYGHGPGTTRKNPMRTGAPEPGDSRFPAQYRSHLRRIYLRNKAAFDKHPSGWVS